eukprot:224278_1
MKLFNLIFILLARYTHCVHHQTTFNASHIHADDPSVSILVNAEHVNTSSDRWRLNPQSQDSYDLLLTLNNGWSFHPTTTSQISLEIDGYRPDISRHDCEFMIVFSDNHKYFSVVIRLDNTLWKYYPPSKALATANDVYSDIIRGNDSPTRQRWDRVSDNDKWNNIVPKYNGPLQWPLRIQITNNPITNTLQYECVVNNRVLRFEYDDVFRGNQTNIYIMNDADDGKPVDIYWIKLQYKDNTTAHVDDVIPTTTGTVTSEYEMTMSATTTMSETQTQTETEMGEVSGTMMMEMKAFAHSNVESADAGVMAGVVIAVVCGVMWLVVGIVYYFKKKEQVDSPRRVNINKSEYHTPRLDLSNTDIENVLEKKRKESTQYSAGFVVDCTQRTQAIMPITSNTSSDEDGGDTEVSNFVCLLFHNFRCFLYFFNFITRIDL